VVLRYSLDFCWICLALGLNSQGHFLYTSLYVGTERQKFYALALALTSVAILTRKAFQFLTLVRLDFAQLLELPLGDVTLDTFLD